MAPARRGKKEWKNAYCLGDEDRQGNQKEKKKKRRKTTTVANVQLKDQHLQLNITL